MSHNLSITLNTQPPGMQRSHTGRCTCGWNTSCGTLARVRTEHRKHQEMAAKMPNGVCEHCGGMLVPVNSQHTLKWFECIRALNTPSRCPGTDRHWRNWPGDEVRRQANQHGKGVVA